MTSGPSTTQLPTSPAPPEASLASLHTATHGTSPWLNRLLPQRAPYPASPLPRQRPDCAESVWRRRAALLDCSRLRRYRAAHQRTSANSRRMYQVHNSLFSLWSHLRPRKRPLPQCHDSMSKRLTASQSSLPRFLLPIPHPPCLGPLRQTPMRWTFPSITTRPLPSQDSLRLLLSTQTKLVLLAQDRPRTRLRTP